jgi:hypothetical protein
MASEASDHSSTDAAQEDVTDTQETDVLCGRGGAALRHPGNQTYRRLVNLNKGLYITCLKTEKLKISRSIVAAIREQKGRFLEKDNKNGTWYDIGDKKAVEKTSQALREGQPKLRKKIVEMGGGVAGTAAFMESQYGHTGLYNPEQVGLTSANLDRGGSMMSQQQRMQHPDMQPPQSMAPPAQHPGDGNADRLMQRLSLSDETGLSGLSMHSGGTLGNGSMHSGGTLGNGSMHSGGPSIHSMDSHHQRNNALQQRMQRLRPSINSRSSHNAQELGFADSNHTLMSEFSAFNGHAMGGQARFETAHTMNMPNDGLGGLQSMNTSFRKTLSGLSSLPQSSGHYPSHAGLDNYSMSSSMDASGHTPIPLPSNGYAGNNVASMGSSAHSSSRDKVGNILDRRRVFAKMKYDRPPSIRRPKVHSSSSLYDGLSDFNMVESTASLFSAFSGVESSNMLKSESNNNLKTDSNHYDSYVPSKPNVETAKVVDHSRLSHYDDRMTGSRHSIMSGLSRISDTSIDHSIFSDLDRKIGNVSTRSLAMSEISYMDMQERDNEDSNNSSS